MCPLSTKNNYRSQHIDKAHSNTVTHKLTENYKQNVSFCLRKNNYSHTTAQAQLVGADMYALMYARLLPAETVLR